MGVILIGAAVGNVNIWRPDERNRIFEVGESTLDLVTGSRP